MRETPHSVQYHRYVLSGGGGCSRPPKPQGRGRGGKRFAPEASPRHPLPLVWHATNTTKTPEIERTLVLRRGVRDLPRPPTARVERCRTIHPQQDQRKSEREIHVVEESTSSVEGVKRSVLVRVVASSTLFLVPLNRGRCRLRDRGRGRRRPGRGRTPHQLGPEGDPGALGGHHRDGMRALVVLQGRPVLRHPGLPLFPTVSRPAVSISIAVRLLCRPRSSGLEGHGGGRLVAADPARSSPEVAALFSNRTCRRVSEG